MKKIRVLRANQSLLIFALASSLGACGGVGNTPAPDNTSRTPAASGGTSVPSPSQGGGTSVPSPSNGGGTTVTPPTPVGGTITNVVLESSATGNQTDVPFTFGQVFAKGALPANKTLVGKLTDGSLVLLQVDRKATHSDGSARHVIVSGKVPQLSAGQAQRMDLLVASADTNVPATTPVNLTNAGFTAGVTLTIAGKAYSASADASLKSGQYSTWLAGAVANEWLVVVPLKDGAGVVHPHLTARFAVRSFNGLNKAKVDVTIENNWAYEPSPQNFTYDVQVNVGGQAVYTKAGLTHFQHARWKKSFWWGSTPQVHVKHNISDLIGSKAVPNYDTSISIPENALSSLATQWSAANKEPMGVGLLDPAMPNAGGRADIGPLPQWMAMDLLSMDRRARTVTLGVGDLAGSWPIHYRDKKTDRPVSLVDYPYMTLLGSSGDAINPATGKTEAFPPCGGDCSTAPYNYQPDSAHQPSLAYFPYLVTGDYYYLEELTFWANWNMLRYNPAYRETSKGLLHAEEVRAQAWSLRTLGQTAYIVPDDHPMKNYFVDRVNANLDWYNAKYTYGNQNQLGVIVDGAIIYTTPAGDQTGVAPWQDDFFTFSVGHVAELGFAKAEPFLAWKAKFPIGRMTAPGYCWIDGSAYSLAVRPSVTSTLYSSFSDAYQASMRKSDGTPLVNSTGARYLDQPCGSQAQADWRTQQDRDQNVARNPWIAGEMVGYADYFLGYPSNMQPALAVAARSGIANGHTAWDIFAARSVKPNNSNAPQWAVVPRN